MARTVINAQTLTSAGLLATYAAVDAANGNYFSNNGKRTLHVKNGGVGSINVTIKQPTTVDGLTVPDRVVAVANGAEKFIGPFGTNTWNQPDGTSVNVDWSGGSSVTAALLEHA